MYLTPGVGAPIPVLVPGFFNEVPGPVDQTIQYQKCMGMSAYQR